MADGDLSTDRGLRLPGAALDEKFARGSGPGGQHRNVTASAVEVVADLRALTGPGADRVRERLGNSVRAQAGESRSQWRNRTVARERLARLLDDAARIDPPRRPTRPSASSRRRRVETKRQAGNRKRSRSWRPEDD